MKTPTSLKLTEALICWQHCVGVNNTNCHTGHVKQTHRIPRVTKDRCAVLYFTMATGLITTVSSHV